MTDQATKDAVFGALAVMEEAQKVTEGLNQTADKALRSIPGAVAKGVEEGIKAGISGSMDTLYDAQASTLEAIQKAAQKAVRDAQGAVAGFGEAEARTRRLWALMASTMLGLGLVIAAGTWGAVTLTTSKAREEVAMIDERIRAGRAALANIESKTFGLELEQSNGVRWVILPDGAKMGSVGEATRGRVAISIKP